MVASLSLHRYHSPGTGGESHYNLHTQGSHRDWKTWKNEMVMEKSWNMKNWPKVIEFCYQSWAYTKFAPELY